MKNIFSTGALVVIAIIAIGGYMFPNVSTQVIEKVVGAAPGPERLSSCESTNGVTKCWEKKKLSLATTTPCSIKSPSSTSTLGEMVLQIDVATTTATTWTLATSTNAFATTTALNRFSLASGAQGTMVGTTTVTDVTALTNGRQVVPPNTYFVWGVAGIPLNLTSDKLLGSCQAEFRVI